MKTKYFIFAVALVALYFVGVTQYISDSEFWPMTLAKEFGSFKADNFALYYKFVFHALLKIPYFFDLTNSQHIMFVKNISTFIGLGIIVAFFCLCQKLFKSSFVSWIMMIVLITTQTFFSQYSRVRSDLLICLIFLISFLHILRVAEKQKFRVVDFVIQSGLVLLAFFCSPKAIYWILMNFGFLFIYLDFLKNRFRAFLICVGSHFFFLSLMMLVGSALNVGALSNAENSTSDALGYFMNSSMILFVYIIRMVQFDLLYVALVMVGLLFFVFQKQRRRILQNRDKAVLYVGIVALGALAIHNQRLPFFIASLLPFISLLMGPLLTEFQTELHDRRVAIASVMLLLFSKYNILYAYGLYWRPNSTQLGEIHQIEKTVQGITSPLVFDGLGVLPRFRNVYLYIDPSPEQDRSALANTIKHANPDVILYNNRSILLEPFLGQELDANFKEIIAGVWVSKKYNLPVDQTPHLPLRYYFTFEPSL